MENPATWGRAEHVVSDVLKEHERQRFSGEIIVGLSLVRKITDALRKEHLLKEELTKQQKVARATETLNYWLERENWEYLNATRPDLVQRLKDVLRDFAEGRR